VVEIAIVTHKDADGVVAGAITVFCLHSINYKVFFIEPSDLPIILKKIIKIKPRKVIITDIGLNKNTFEESLKHLSTMRNQGIDILWFDHHIWDSSWILEISKVAKLHIDSSTCATGIVYNVLCKGKNDMLNRIVKATCSADLWLFDDIYAPWIYRYIAYYENNLEEAFSKVLNLLKRNEFLNEEVLCVIERIMDKELELLTKYLSEVKIREVCGYKIAFIIKRHKIPQTSIIANYLNSVTGADIIAIINVDSCSISLRSKKCNVREIAKALGGGGHARAAGAKLNMPLRCLALKLRINLNIQSIIEKKLKDIICRIKNKI